jgi:hypothetical protein
VGLGASSTCAAPATKASPDLCARRNCQFTAARRRTAAARLGSVGRPVKPAGSGDAGPDSIHTPTVRSGCSLAYPTVAVPQKPIRHPPSSVGRAGAPSIPRNRRSSPAAFNRWSRRQSHIETDITRLTFPFFASASRRKRLADGFVCCNCSPCALHADPTAARTHEMAHIATWICRLSGGVAPSSS